MSQFFFEECTHGVPKASFQNNCLNVTWVLNLMDYSLDKCIENSLFSNNQIKIKFAICLESVSEM